LRCLQDVIDHFEDDVLHAWEVESLYRQLDTVLNGDPLMYFIFVIVLDSQHETQLERVGLLSVPLHQVDQVIHYVVGEGLDVLDYYQHDLLAQVLRVQDALHSEQSLLLNDV
jgi:hypothetical protein